MNGYGLASPGFGLDPYGDPIALVVDVTRQTTFSVGAVVDVTRQGTFSTGEVTKVT